MAQLKSKIVILSRAKDLKVSGNLLIDTFTDPSHAQDDNGGVFDSKSVR